MTISESDSLWVRHLSGERLQPWEEQRLLRFLDEDPELKDALLRDHEMDGLLRALDRARSSGDRFLRETRSLILAEKDRTRFVSRFRERLKRSATTRRVSRPAAPPPPAPKLGLIAAEFLIGAFLLWAALSSSSDDPRPAIQARQVPVEPPAPPADVRAVEWAPKRPSEPPSPEAVPLPPVRPAPAPLPAAPPEPAPATAGGRRDTVTALAILDRVDGEVYVRTEQGLAPARAGRPLRAGEGIVTVGPRSRAAVKYPDSTRFLIRGETIVRELAEGGALDAASRGVGKRVALSQGSFSIDVARQPADAPMEIVTPVARITVVGTRFSVACGPDATRVMVDEGRVRLTSLARDEAVDAAAGDCASATAARIWSARPLRTYALPADWKGSKTESAQGNPYRVESRPTWRLDQVWPDDPAKVENYTPLVWNGLFWRSSEHGSGGQPSAEVSETELRLGVRMWWPDQLGSKLSSLAFVAPADGIYSVEGTARTEVWEGGAPRPLILQVLKMDRKEKQVTEIASILLATPQLLELHDLAVPLKSQQELIFVPQFPERAHVACTYLFEGLRISRYKP